MVINSNKEANEILDTESKLSEPAAGVEKGLSIWQLAFPSILGNLSYTLVGMVQVKFVGELGTEALAAMGAGSRVFFALPGGRVQTLPLRTRQRSGRRRGRQ